MRVSVTWKVYPDCPQATEYYKKREHQRVKLSTVWAAAFIFSLLSLFFVSEGPSGEYFTEGLLTILGTVIFGVYVMVIHPLNTERKAAKMALEAQAKKLGRMVQK